MYDYDDYCNEIEISITFGVNNSIPRKDFHEEPKELVFTYFGDDPTVEDGEWEDEDGNPITPTDEMISYIRQQLWVQQTTYSSEPRSELIDGVFVIYTLEIIDGVCRWQFHSVSATDWDGGCDEHPVDLSTISQDQMKEIITKADKSFDKFVAYYPQWRAYKHIDFLDSEIN